MHHVYQIFDNHVLNKTINIILRLLQSKLILLFVTSHLRKTNSLFRIKLLVRRHRRTTVLVTNKINQNKIILKSLIKEKNSK